MRFVAGRLLQAIVVVAAVATLTFVLLHLAPGDPLPGGESSRYASAEARELERRKWGLDQPVQVQYRRYLGNLLRGDFGESSLQHRPAWDAISEAMGNTMILAVAALLVDFSIGIALGVAQGTRPGSPFDRTISTATLALYSIPVFWLGLMLMLVFGLELRWFPIGGIHTAGRDGSGLAGALDVLGHLILPALTLGLVGAAGTARYQRAEILEVIRQDFIRTARAKGLREQVVLLRHALRNALLPTITLAGLSLPVLLSGAVLVETVFGWPGMGKLSADAYFGRDYDVVTGTAILAAALVATGNLVADLSYHIADPRTRVGA